MLRHMFAPALLLALTFQGAPAQAQPDHDRGRSGDQDDRRDRDEHRGRGRGKERREELGRPGRDRDGRGPWKARPYRYEDRAHPGRYLAPPWMVGYWRPRERRYVALIPGDPSRCYVFIDGRWLLRRIEDPQARLDIEGAFSLPMAPPPVPPPHLGLGINLHVVLFN